MFNVASAISTVLTMPTNDDRIVRQIPRTQHGSRISEVEKRRMFDELMQSLGGIDSVIRMLALYMGGAQEVAKKILLEIGGEKEVVAQICSSLLDDNSQSFPVNLVLDEDDRGNLQKMHKKQRLAKIRQQGGPWTHVRDTSFNKDLEFVLWFRTRQSQEYFVLGDPKPSHPTLLPNEWIARWKGYRVLAQDFDMRSNTSPHFHDRFRRWIELSHWKAQWELFNKVKISTVSWKGERKLQITLDRWDDSVTLCQSGGLPEGRQGIVR